MTEDSDIPTSFMSNTEDILNKESGLLDGVGNEVWIGLFSILFFLWFSKYIVDVYLFPISHATNNNRASIASDPGKYTFRISTVKTLLTTFRVYISKILKFRMVITIFQVALVLQIIITTAPFA